MAAAEPDGLPPTRRALQQSLGSGWQVAPAGPLEAYRRPRRDPAADFETRRQSVASELRRRSRGITVDFGRDSVHLAGEAIDCDRVVAASQQLAAIPGINDVVIDTACRPGD